MKKKISLAAYLVVMCLLMGSFVSAAQESDSTQASKQIVLPKPQTQGGKPLMQALEQRQTTRSFRNDALPLQTLSNLLWAANGINRPASGKRTAPSAVNWQEIDVYVALPEGLYLYDAAANALKLVISEDIRAATGMQGFVKNAPVNLIYVADLSRMNARTPEDQAFYAATDTGFISQNVYLFCASEGLGTVVRGLIERPRLATLMKLREDQRIILAQTIGFPK